MSTAAYFIPNPGEVRTVAEAIASLAGVARVIETGGNICFSTCPLCGGQHKNGYGVDKYTFGISTSSGAWNCFRSSCTGINAKRGNVTSGAFVELAAAFGLSYMLHDYSAYIAAWTSLGASRVIGTRSYEWQANAVFAPLACVKAIWLGAGFTFNSYVFAGCGNLERISIPASITSLEQRAFASCAALKCVTIPRGVTSIPAHCFNAASCCLVCMSKTVTSIGENAFHSSQRAENGHVQNHITTIGNSAFYNNKGIVALHIPTSVTSIGGDAYTGNTGILAILCYSATPPTLANARIFNNLAYMARILVPYTAIGNYIDASNWGEYAEWTAGFGTFSAGSTVPGVLDIGWDSGMQWYPSIDDMLNDTNRCNVYGSSFTAQTTSVFYGMWVDPDGAAG